MPKDDDDDSWNSDNCTPAVEILNYDLNNVGLKELYESDNPLNKTQVHSTIGQASKSKKEPSTSTDGSSKTAQTKKGQEQKKLKPGLPKEKVKFVIGSLPSPEPNEDEKATFHIDHADFLKHAMSNHSSLHRNDSIRNIDSQEHDNHTSRSLGVQQPHKIDSVEHAANPAIGQTTKTTEAPQGKQKPDSIKQTKPVAKDEDCSECSDDEIPAREILNYDLNNIGLKKLDDQNNKSGTPKETVEESDSSSDDDAAPMPSKPSTDKPKPAPSKTKEEDRSDCSDDEIPAREILNYDLNNIGLKKFDDVANIDKESKEAAEDSDSINEDDVVSCPSTADNTRQNPNPTMASQEKEKVHPAKVDDNSDCSDDEIPAREILNYDLNNIGLKKLDEQNGNDRNSKETVEESDSSSDNDAAPIPSTPSAAKQKPDQSKTKEEDSSDCSDDEIPAREILNYDLSNIGLKKFDEQDNGQSDPKNNETVEESSSSSGEDEAASQSKPISARQEPALPKPANEQKKQPSKDNDSSECSDDEIPAREILNYDLNNIGLKKFDKQDRDSKVLNDHVAEGEDDDSYMALSSDATKSAQRDSSSKSPDESEQIAPQDISEKRKTNEEPFDESSDSTEDERLAGESLSKYLTISSSHSNVHLDKKIKNKSENFIGNDDSSESTRESGASKDPKSFPPALTRDLSLESKLNLSSRSSDDSSSQQTKDSGIPGKYDCDDHGHFLLLAAEKRKTKLQEKQKKKDSVSQTVMMQQNPSSSHPSSSMAEDCAKNGNIESQTKSCLGLDSNRSALLDQPTILSNPHVETTVTTTVVTKTKTVVEPDGTMVTITTITTKTISNANQPSQPVPLAAVHSSTDNGQVQATKPAPLSIPKSKNLPDVDIDTSLTVQTKPIDAKNNKNDSAHTEKQCLMDANRNNCNWNSARVVTDKKAGEIDAIVKAKKHNPAVVLKKDNEDPTRRHNSGSSKADYSSESRLNGNSFGNKGIVVASGASKETLEDDKISRNIEKAKVNDRHEDETSTPKGGGKPSNPGPTKPTQQSRLSVERLDDDSYEGSSDIDSASERSSEKLLYNQTDFDDRSASSRETGNGSSRSRKEDKNPNNNTFYGNKGVTTLLKQNEFNVQYGSLSSYEKHKSPSISTANQFEDHVGFLSDAASNKSNIDTENLAEQEKRNDEIAKKKIASFGVGTGKASPVRQAASPISPRNVPASLNSNSSSNDPCGESDISQSEEGDEIPAREILNYDLTNAGLKNFSH